MNNEKEPVESTEEALEAEKATEAPAREPGTPRKPDGPTPIRALRSVYWAIWFVLAPLVLAAILVWALTPASGIDRGGILGWIEERVRDQPVPFGIVTFTLFEMALWAVRHHLPLAFHAHPPLRDGLPKGMRGPFEKARGLLEEAESLLERHKEAVVRDLSSKEREQLRTSLESLEETMQR